MHLIILQERAEWINSIIQQLWQNVGHYTRKVVNESVEPAVKSALDGYGMKGFKFEKVVLGRVPPRVTGIKVYEKNVARDEIIMDLDIVFASDCDIKFSVTKIAAKISDFRDILTLRHRCEISHNFQMLNYFLRYHQKICKYPTLFL